MRTVSIQLLIVFALTQFLALFVGAQFLNQKVSMVEDPSNLGNAFFLLAYILAATVVLLLVLRFYKGGKLFYAMELLLEFATVQLAVMLFASDLVALIAGALVVIARVMLPRARNVFLLFATGVVGALLGASLELLPVVLLSGLLAAYDIIAVFGSKHMITLAKQLESRGAAFAVSLKQGKESIQLGTGDLVMPAMISVSSLRLAQNALPALFAFCGALVGLALIIFVLEKRKGYWPALPPLVFGSFAFLGLWWALKTLALLS